MTKNPPITMFTWGYWGWGNATHELIKGVDAVEQARSFAPPVFVDIRIRRAVRALGFSGDTFEKTVGSARYQWMPELGNLAILDHSLQGIHIKQPGAANDLLDLAMDLVKHNQRVIFFCSCEHPYEAGKPFCHRVQVANLVFKHAKQRQVPVQLIEWPGDEPQIIDLNLDSATLRKVTHGLKNLTLPQPVPLAKYVGLGWGSVVRAYSEDNQIAFRTGPARWVNQEWCLPVLTNPIDPPRMASQLFASAAKWRRENGYAAHQQKAR